MAVLEGEPGAEVPFQAAADRVAGEGPQQLTALGLGGRRHLVVGELAAGRAQLGHTVLTTSHAYGSDSRTQATNSASATSPRAAVSSRAGETLSDMPPSCWK